jgi:hypothetical protein
VIFNEGDGRSDATCSQRPVSVPHALAGLTPQKSERIFASGNERTVISIPKDGVTDAGYKLKKDDKFHLIVDLMNMAEEDRTVWLTVTFDYVFGHHKDWSDVKPVWLDVNQCGTSEVIPPKNQSKNQ